MVCLSCVKHASLSLFSNWMPSSFMASKITLNDCMMLLYTTGFHSSFSFLLNPWVYMSFICFRTVDFPDSPAPAKTHTERRVSKFRHENMGHQ